MWPYTTSAVVFFFQAEDGIRDYKVTGVQTCALPICARFHPDRHRFLFHFYRLLLSAGAPPGCPSRVHPRDLGRNRRGYRAGGPGIDSGGPLADAVTSPAVSRVRDLSGALYRQRRNCGLRPKHSIDTHRNMVRSCVDVAAARERAMGRELAAGITFTKFFSPASEAFRRIVAYQRNVRAGPSDCADTSRGTWIGGAAGAVFPPWALDHLLRGPAGDQPVSRGSNVAHPETPQSRDGLRDQRNCRS